MHLPPVNATEKHTAETLEAGRVARYHAAPTVQPQTDGLHSWGVLVIALFLTGGEASRELLIECAMHDTGELHVGDVPFTTMRDDKGLYTIIKQKEAEARMAHMLVPTVYLDPREMAVLKIADTIEGYVWCTKTEERCYFIRERWRTTFLKALDKFANVISPAEYLRSVNLMDQYGAAIPASYFPTVKAS